MKKLIFTALSASLLMASCASNCDKNNGEKSQNVTASLAVQSGIKVSKTTVNKKDGKKVLVISSSPRKGGNTDLLCDEFVKGATEAGGKVEKIFLADYQLDFLSEVGANKPHDVCRDSSETGRIINKFLEADVVCLASPTYYMNVNDRMKTFIDATYLAWGDPRLGNKEYYYITACAQNSAETAEWCINGFRGFVMCTENPTERGYVSAIGMGRAGAVEGTPFMTEAYNLGKSINE